MSCKDETSLEPFLLTEAHHRDDFPMQPHFIVESSPGKFHYYWRVDDDRSDLAEEAMARIIAAHPGGEWKAAKPKDGQDGERHPFKLAVEVLGTEAT